MSRIVIRRRRDCMVELRHATRRLAPGVIWAVSVGLFAGWCARDRIDGVAIGVIATIAVLTAGYAGCLRDRLADAERARMAAAASFASASMGRLISVIRLRNERRLRARLQREVAALHATLEALEAEQ